MKWVLMSVSLVCDVEQQPGGRGGGGHPAQEGSCQVFELSAAYNPLWQKVWIACEANLVVLDFYQEGRGEGC